MSDPSSSSAWALLLAHIFACVFLAFARSTLVRNLLIRYFAARVSRGGVCKWPRGAISDMFCYHHQQDSVADTTHRRA
eukprot:scaffold81188_cov75-Phaeocystis_antarctica.AAC.3